MELSWVEISKAALIHNIKTFRKLLGKDVVLGVAVKANAYGHGMIECAKIFEKNGADYLCVNALFEAEELRKAGLKSPILIMGYTPLSDLGRVIKLKCDLVVYNKETIKALGKVDKKVNVHLKIETGNHRQGIRLEDLPGILKLLDQCKKIQVAGISTHFANLEDRINHQYALYQLKEFKKAIRMIEEGGHAPRYRHCASTAAAILLPEAHFNFVRIGIGAYGLWPSEKTLNAAERAGINITLKPALTWKSIVSQVKEVKKGSLIGYGCTYEMPRNGRIAVIPVGYYDGYVRALSSKGFVLIKGEKAPVLGRICMNMIMVDITDIPDVKLEDEVVLIGRQGKNQITAEDIGEWSGTINYEVTTRIGERILRIYI
ncbi:alanine racemase [Patescibacteria group bacterium]|nr:alanine racemase [Patescibacteria group bacterium]MBU1682362.1 alanine racemase [Patescibacteria group bacterium]MBU1935050.1 alanine racemase [Patescibacteria group bacterium]